MPAPVRSDSPVFIVGCPRSGTTLLRNLLRSHPNLTFPEESNFIPAFFQAYGNPRDAREATMLAARILRLRWVRSWELPVDAGSFADCRSFRDILCCLYEAWARKEDKPRWGDKTPYYVTHIPLLAGLFPAARFVHIHRDGRDVALSALAVRLNVHNVFAAARTWKRFVTAGRKAGAALPRESYMELSYEALLADPAGTMKGVCAFLGESYDPAMLRPNHVKLRPRYNLLRSPQISTTELVPSNSAKWKERMSRHQRLVFESVAGDLLESLGYETEWRAPRIHPAEEWMWKLHQTGIRTLWWPVRRARAARDPAYLATFFEMERARIRACCRRANPSTP